MTDKSTFLELVDRYILGEITQEEHLFLAGLLEQPEYADWLDEHMKEHFDTEAIRERILFPNHKQLQSLRQRLAIKVSPITIDHDRKSSNSVHRIPAFRRWGWVAAAMILLLGTAAYFWMEESGNIQSTVHTAKSEVIPPGKEGAILTLANGRQLVLDSLGNGLIANQQGAQVLLNDGQLAYTSDGQQVEEVVYNTMSTPKGRQFRLTLPDGSKVWLNAASSIRYPTTFNGKERKVEVTGEAYFEVTKNEKQPFHVNVNNKAEIEVLGTHFNVNAYEDEADINATLVEGSVRVSASQQTVILKPGQQAKIDASSIKINEEPDMAVILSWKSDRFVFVFTQLDAVLRQLSRWYDVEVVYEKNIPAIQVMGDIPKTFTLSDALFMLDKLGVRFKIEGKKLIVMP